MNRNPLEKWILNQVAMGNVADLNQFDPNELELKVSPCDQMDPCQLRRLSASFFQELITGKAFSDQDQKVDSEQNRKPGVHIKNAYIAATMTLVANSEAGDQH